ncbi:hypothetical protein V5799_018351 [Amblyomma americanum]|uniref:AMP-dependent synthetase/ligase domain-containing protein n=1 Tax=Amblyomma americanum TaxID=6943 RepID=A0AAQ4EZS1_AMBAM
MQRYAAGFQKHGLEPGHRVCVHLDNSTENFAAMWACVFAGASVVLVNASLTEREVHYQLRDSECTHVLTDPACAEKVSKAVASQKMKGLFATGPAEGFVSVAAFRQLDEASFREVLIQDPHDCVLCIGYTSGTTGLPKGAVTTHYGFVASMVTARPCFARDKSDVVLVAAPMLHGSGFFFITVSVLLGATVVIASLGVTLQRVSDLVKKYKRLKDMIKCMDIQVIPAELEELILQEYSEHISEVVVFGLQHQEYGDAPAAAVVLKGCSRECDLECLAKKIKATVAVMSQKKENLKSLD